MKFIIAATTDTTELTALLRAKGHLVHGVTKQPEQILPLIFKHAPHGIFVCGKKDDEFVKKTVRMTTAAPKQIILLRDASDSLEIFEKQIQALGKIIRLRIQPPIPESRHIWFDPAFGGLLGSEKLNTADDSEVTKSSEKDKFVSFLETALNNFHEARHYWADLKKLHQEETQEISYRIFHGSAKGLAYAQEQVGRYLGVLAHFVPGTQISLLPTPGDPVAGSRWVHHGSSPETRYAFGCVRAFGIQHYPEKLIDFLLSQRFLQGEEETLTSKSTTLLGVCALLDQVIVAQFALAEKFALSRYTQSAWELNQRRSRRDFQTYCEFWSMPLLREWPNYLIEASNEFHGGRCTNTTFATPDPETIWFPEIETKSGPPYRTETGTSHLSNDKNNGQR